MDLRLQTEDSLRAASDAFVTFLYAASVHLIVAHSARPGPMTTQMSVVVLLFILFLFSDWLSRVRLPWLLPPGDEVGFRNQFAKTILEVSGLFFLVLAWLAAIEGNTKESTPSFSWSTREFWDALWAAPLNPYRAFAIFLLATFFWNLFMLLVMRQLTWLDLARLGMNGDALDSPNVEVYAKRFWQFRERLEERVAEGTKPAANKTAHNLNLAIPVLLNEAFARTSAQIVAIHIAWASVSGAVIILIGDILFHDKSVGIAMGQKLAAIDWTSRAAAFVVISVLAFVVIAVLERRETWTTWTLHTIGFSVFIFLAVIVSFLLSSSRSQIELVIISLVATLAGPTAIFLAASQCEKEGTPRKIVLWFAGSLGVMIMLLLYLMVESRVLMVIVAVQQVMVNGFLQYAASERPISVVIRPERVTLREGETQLFKVRLAGTTNTKVTWEATAGDINSEGLFTPPSTGGTFVIRAVPAADPSRFAEATVTVPDKTPKDNITSSPSE
jgi:hypothetical protein